MLAPFLHKAYQEVKTAARKGLITVAQVTADFLGALFTNYRVIWEQEFVAAETAIDYEAFCTVVESTTDTESYNWLGEVPVMQEWFDERQLSAMQPYTYSLRNRSFEGTIEVDRNELLDDKYNLVRPRITQLAEEAAAFPARLATKTLAAGASTACFDGGNFFATNHVLETQAAQSNLVTGTGVTLAQVRADLIASRTAMRRFKDGKGRVMNLRPDTVLIPADLEDVFEQLIHTNMIALSTGTQMDNVLHNSVDIMVDAYLADYNPSGHGDDWYLMCTKRSIKPLVMQWRQQPDFVSLDSPQSEQNFMRRRLLYGVDMRLAVGYGFWSMAIQVAN